MRGETAIARILKAEGVEFITCFPYNTLIDAAAEEGIRTILTRTERVAVNIADGFTRASYGQRNGVCTMQSGPGIENAFSPPVVRLFFESFEAEEQDNMAIIFQ